MSEIDDDWLIESERRNPLDSTRSRGTKQSCRVTVDFEQYTHSCTERLKAQYKPCKRHKKCGGILRMNMMMHDAQRKKVKGRVSIE